MKIKFNHCKQVLGYFAPYKFSLIGVFIALIFSSGAVLCIGKALEFLIDQGLKNGDSTLLNHSILILLSIIILLAIATFFRTYLVNQVAEKTVAAIRKDIYNKVLVLSPGFFELNKTSQIISRLTTDANLLSNIIGSVASVSLRNLLMAIGGFIFLIITSPRLTFYVVIIVPIILLLIIIIGRRVRKSSKEAQDETAALAAQIDETLNGIKTVQAYGRENLESLIFLQKLNNGQEKSLAWIRIRAILVAIVIFTIFSSVILVLWIAGHDVLQGKMTAGELSSFIFYAVMVASSIGGLTEAIADIQRASGATERLFSLLNAKSEIIDNPKNIIEFTPGPIQLSFENVSFAYPTRESILVLDQINLNIMRGENLAIVGPSGSGKTTLFQLLLRFYNTKSGNILLDGVNIKDLSLEYLRAQFAMVSQDTVIFSASAYDNISYGKINASMEEVREAAKAANILDFLDKLPQGLNSFLGEKGVRLSGGQRQRIAIARAILKNAPILLLDEATSNLDNENEKLVQQALEKLRANRTTIIIAHRLSTIINADRIILLNKSKIEAEGTHQELIKQKGLYAHLSGYEANL